MNQYDTENKTATVEVSSNFISCDKVKGGAKISMGVPEYYISDIMNDKKMAVLLFIDKSEYNKRK